MHWVTLRSKRELKHYKRKVDLGLRAFTMLLLKATLLKMRLKRHFKTLIHLHHKQLKSRNLQSHLRFIFHHLIVKALLPNQKWVLVDLMTKYYLLQLNKNKTSVLLDNDVLWYRYNSQLTTKVSNSSLKKFKTKEDLQPKWLLLSKITFMIFRQDTKCKSKKNLNQSKRILQKVKETQ